MPHLVVHRYWKRPLLEPFQQPKLEFQEQDSRRSVHCPIYVNACKRSIYLCSSGNISLQWHGGTSLDIEYPEWWTNAYKEERDSWLLERAQSKDNEDAIRRSRFIHDTPLGALNGGRMLHQGGLLLNWFTGLSLQTAPGFKVLVTRATNRYEPNWTIQDGIYDSDSFPVDFSLNIQLLTQNPIYIRLGEPIASLWVIPAEATDLRFLGVTDSRAQREKSDMWYREKSRGTTYGNHPGCPHSGKST